MGLGLIFLFGCVTCFMLGFVLCFYVVKTPSSRQMFLNELNVKKPTPMQDDVFLGVKE